jgi:pentalenolactone synthase
MEAAMADDIQLPLDQPHLLQAPPALRALQADGPIHRVRTPVGDPGWLVTNYEEIRQLFGDHDLGRAHPEPEHAARTGNSALFGGPLGDFETEAQDHARMRRLLQPHFSPKRMRELQPRVAALTASLFDDLARRDPPADLIDALALPLPVLVICELLGVPYADRARFRGWTQDVADVRDRVRSERGLAALFDYGLYLVARKRADPTATSSPRSARPTASMTTRSPVWRWHCSSRGTKRQSCPSALAPRPFWPTTSGPSCSRTPT